MIIQEISESQFIREFDEYNRGDNFSVNGRAVLYEYLSEFGTEEEPFKLDIIAICCDFSEYKNLNEYLRDYENTTEEEKKNQYIEDNDLINEFKDNLDGDKNFNYKENEFKEWFKDLCEEEFLNEIEQEIENKTTLLKLGDDLNEGFIIHCY